MLFTVAPLSDIYRYSPSNSTRVARRITGAVYGPSRARVQSCMSSSGSAARLLDCLLVLGGAAHDIIFLYGNSAVCGDRRAFRSSAPRPSASPGATLEPPGTFVWVL